VKVNRTIGLILSTALFFLAAQSFLAAQTSDYACSCQPEVSPKGEFRYESKHVRLPKTPAEEITIKEITDWIPQYFPGETFSTETPRQDRELRLFHISHAFLQAAWINRRDCDFHLEISTDEKKDSSRIIVEMTKEYCSERKELQTQMAAKGFVLDEKLHELPQPVPVDIVGLAFQDNAEPRGSSKVNSLWEIHPAIVKIVSPRALQKIK
jgi:hypothetical protein